MFTLHLLLFILFNDARITKSNYSKILCSFNIRNFVKHEINTLRNYYYVNKNEHIMCVLTNRTTRRLCVLQRVTLLEIYLEIIIMRVTYKPYILYLIIYEHDSYLLNRTGQHN